MAVPPSQLVNSWDLCGKLMHQPVPSECMAVTLVGVLDLVQLLPVISPLPYLPHFFGPGCLLEPPAVYSFSDLDILFILFTATKRLRPCVSSLRRSGGSGFS